MTLTNESPAKGRRTASFLGVALGAAAVLLAIATARVEGGWRFEVYLAGSAIAGVCLGWMRTRWFLATCAAATAQILSAVVWAAVRQKTQQDYFAFIWPMSALPIGVVLMAAVGGWVASFRRGPQQ